MLILKPTLRFLLEDSFYNQHNLDGLTRFEACKRARNAAHGNQINGKLAWHGMKRIKQAEKRMNRVIEYV